MEFIARALRNQPDVVEERAAQGMSDDVGGYTLHVQEVTASWGGPVAVAHTMLHTSRKR